MKANILIVDDEQPIRNMLSRHFKMLGYHTETAENGRAAIDVLNAKRVDIVISDIMMPVMSGVDLLRTIRDEFPMVRVIMITGYVTLQNALACMENQADDVIFKPFVDLEELEDAVDSSLSILIRWQKKLRELYDMNPARKGSDESSQAPNDISNESPAETRGKTAKVTGSRRTKKKVTPKAKSTAATHKPSATRKKAASKVKPTAATRKPSATRKKAASKAKSTVATRKPSATREKTSDK